MNRVLRTMLTGVPLGITGVSLLLAFVVESVLLGVLGVALAGAVALPKILSRKRRLIESMAAVSGSVDRAVVADLTKIADALEATQRVSGLEQLGIQAVGQFEGVIGKYLGFREVLGAKFNSGELTYQRYSQSGEQVYRAVLDDLDSAATMMRAVGAVDLDQVRAQLRILRRKDDPTEAERVEMGALDERLALREKEVEQVRSLLASNEQALTSLTRASSSLAGIETEAGRAALDAGTAMGDLEDLAKRAERYALAKDG